MYKGFKSEDKRRGPREACETTASYVKMKKDQSFEEGKATVLNVSAGGMRLRLPTPLAPGSLIELTLPHGQFTTVLEACWSKPQKQPSHRTQYRVGCRILYACFG